MLVPGTGLRMEDLCQRQEGSKGYEIQKENDSLQQIVSIRQQDINNLVQAITLKYEKSAPCNSTLSIITSKDEVLEDFFREFKYSYEKEKKGLSTEFTFTLKGSQQTQYTPFQQIIHQINNLCPKNYPCVLTENFFQISFPVNMIEDLDDLCDEIEEDAASQWNKFAIHSSFNLEIKGRTAQASVKFYWHSDTRENYIVFTFDKEEYEKISRSADLVAASYRYATEEKIHIEFNEAAMLCETRKLLAIMDCDEPIAVKLIQTIRTKNKESEERRKEIKKETSLIDWERYRQESARDSNWVMTDEEIGESCISKTYQPIPGKEKTIDKIKVTILSNEHFFFISGQHETINKLANSILAQIAINKSSFRNFNDCLFFDAAKHISHYYLSKVLHLITHDPSVNPPISSKLIQGIQKVVDLMYGYGLA